VSRARYLTVLASVAALVLGLLTGPASRAATPPGWQVTPESFGSLYGRADKGGLASVRFWGSAIWCYVQPTAGADIAANLTGLIGTELDEVAATGGGTAMITIGHPAPWVFDNAAAARRPTRGWACGNHASGVSIPSPESLKGSSVQTKRWTDYVDGVVSFLQTRYGNSLRVVLQVWNEPNLSSGLDPNLKVPGAARTTSQAVSALHRYEELAKQVIARRNLGGQYQLASSSLFTRNNTFSKLYLKAQNRSRNIDSVAFNIYGFQAKTPTSMVSEWSSRAGEVRKRLHKYGALRRLPLMVTEVNLNLVNNGGGSNLRPTVTNSDEQRRMATATQMNAYYNGASAVYWLIPTPKQAAVQIRTTPGNPARDALANLQAQLLGRTMRSCSSSRGVRSCRFSDPSGARADAVVYWRMSGQSSVSVRGTSVTRMNGEQAAVSGGRVVVGPTPIVVS
jgi:hypothetical protein